MRLLLFSLTLLLIASTSTFAQTPTDASTPDTTATEVIENLRVCNYAETAECRQQSLSTMEECMEQCNEHLEVFGHRTAAYRECFIRNKESIIEAERCLFEDTKCTNKAVYVKPTSWESFSDIKYEGQADTSIKHNLMWKRDERKYTNIQTFFHCTKHCMHNIVHGCSAAKECTIQMPTHDKFAAKMRECTKNNSKITKSIFDACQCLAWNRWTWNSVYELRGSCVIIGNQFYIDRA